jgi:hypothetical protein
MSVNIFIDGYIKEGVSDNIGRKLDWIPAYVIQDTYKIDGVVALSLLPDEIEKLVENYTEALSSIEELIEPTVDVEEDKPIFIEDGEASITVFGTAITLKEVDF